MKLRKIGNSLGTTFTRETLSKAGITEDIELEVIASPGELKIRPAANRVLVEFSEAEAKALVDGKTNSKRAEAALQKVRRALKAE